MKKFLLILFAVIIAIFAGKFLILKYDQTAVSSPTVIRAVLQDLEVNGRKTKVFNLIRQDGKEGYIGKRGDYFNVILRNETHVPISIHWHGIILPNDQDGVPYVTQLPIKPGESKHYYYRLNQSGTFWMHSFYKLHEQRLMSAPMIIEDSSDPFKENKNIVMMLNDFSFTKSYLIFHELKRSEIRGIDKVRFSRLGENLNDVRYDAMLANRRTLRNPEIIWVKPGEKRRLRIINAASASNFWIDTGKLTGRAIAIDGNLIHPFRDNKFQLAIAQRIDIEITIPSSGGIFPILAQVNGAKQQTGIILATPGVAIPQYSEKAATIAPALNTEQEMKIHPLNPLWKQPIKTVLNYSLEGDMDKYIWTINHETWPFIKPLMIKEGDRVAMVFRNNTKMAHPMHFHGHVFQVLEIDGKPLNNGPLRDTILILPNSSQKIIFDANNPGIWMLHCHVLYHMAAGMMTTINYFNYPEPEFYKSLIKGEIKNKYP